MLLYRRLAGGSAAAAPQFGGLRSVGPRHGCDFRHEPPGALAAVGRPAESASCSAPIDQGPTSPPSASRRPDLTQEQAPLRITAVEAARRSTAFIRVPLRIFESDPAWVPPLVARAAPPSFGQAQSVLPARAMAGVDRVARERARRPDQRADRCAAPRAVCRCHRLLRDARCRRSRRTRSPRSSEPRNNGCASRGCGAFAALSACRSTRKRAS